MSAWQELKPVLRRLSAQRPQALSSSPDLDADGDEQPPFVIDLAPWAVEAAQELHRRFGDDVELTVGLLRYPTRELPRLGYAIPPGEWQVQAPVTPGTGPRKSPVRTIGPLPLTVTG